MSKKFLGFDYSDSEKIKVLFYLIIGGTAALIEWIAFYLLNSHAGVGYLLSATLAFLFSTICHYFATNYFVFDSGVRYSKGKEFALVLVVSAMGLGLNLLLMWIFVELFSLLPILAKILASALVTVWNYLSRKKWIY